MPAITPNPSSYLTVNPAALSAAYQIGSQTGIAPNLLLGQFMAENHQNLSGTGALQNNFANLMTPTHQIASFPNVGAFVNAYVSTIKHNFPGAINVGTNAAAFGNALANGRNGMVFQNTIPAATYTANITKLSNTPAALSQTWGNKMVQAVNDSMTSGSAVTPTTTPTTFTGWLKQEGANIAFIVFGIVLAIFALKQSGIVKMPPMPPIVVAP